MQFLIAESLWQRGDLIFVVAGALICVVPVGYIVWHWRKAEIEAGLRRDLLARGMSPEEVKRVIRAPSQMADD